MEKLHRILKDNLKAKPEHDEIILYGFIGEKALSGHLLLVGIGYYRTTITRALHREINKISP